jgi:hypothetical protein
VLLTNTVRVNGRSFGQWLTIRHGVKPPQQHFACRQNRILKIAHKSG